MSTPFYDLASLVVVPSGYKASKVYAQKPLTTDGQLAFTRSTTATRVGPDGLIEKVRTNLLTYSNTFSNAAWTKNNVTLTSGQADPNGGTQGTRVQFSGVSYMFQAPSTAFATASVYIRATTGTASIRIGDSNGNYVVAYNLTTAWQRITAFGSAMSGISIDSFIGGSWTAQDVIVAFAQFETGDIATDYIATTTAAVSVGPVANVPRLDYLNSSCPRLLLEPQRSSLVLFSEQLNNAAWVKSNASVTANQTTSPSGYVDADKLVENSSSSFHDTNQQSIAYTAAAYTISVFAKAAGRNHIFLQIFDGVTFYTSGTFNLSNGTVSGSGSIVSYGNGWYRCSFTATTAIGSGGAYINLSNGTTGNYAGDGTSGVFLYGAQVEAGAYATSYIPTLGASVTRGADAASKTGISSLIGQTEGTLFAEISTQQAGATASWLNLSDGSSVNWIFIGKDINKMRGFLRVNGSTIFSNETFVITDAAPMKVALAYKSGDYAMYINGALIISGTASFSFSAALSQINFGVLTSPVDEVAKYKQALLFKTRLTNAQLAELTTI